MNAIDTETLPNRWPRLLSDAYINCKGSSGSARLHQRKSTDEMSLELGLDIRWGSAVRNAGWMLQTKKQHEQTRSGPKTHEGVAKESRIIIDWQLQQTLSRWGLPSSWDWGNQGWVSTQKCWRELLPKKENLQHASHDPSWSLMISYQHGHRPLFLSGAELGHMKCPRKNHQVL